MRILDNLEPNTHKRGKPAWINRDAEFVQGDLRDRATIENALSDIDIVFHQAAYGGYMPEMAKYVQVNSFGTAQMLEVIREKNLPIKKVIVASSQAVYSEGAGECPKHGLVFPKVRPVEQLQRGDWSVRCPICNRANHERADARGGTGWRGNGLWINQSRSGEIGTALGKTSRDPNRRAALLVHLRTATIDLQSLYRRDRDFLHAFAQ